MDRQWQLLFELVTHSIWLAGGDGDGVVVVDNCFELRDIVTEFNKWQKTQPPDNQYQIPMAGPHPPRNQDSTDIVDALFTSNQSGLLFVTRESWANHRDKYPPWFGSDITVFI